MIMIWIFVLAVVVFLILLVFEDELHVLSFLSDVYVWLFYITLVAVVVLIIYTACNEHTEKRQEGVECTRVIVDSVELN